MELDEKPTFSRRDLGNGPENLVDDDDLQAALSRSRRENAKKRPKVKAEDIAAQSKYCTLCIAPMADTSSRSTKGRRSDRCKR